MAAEVWDRSGNVSADNVARCGQCVGGRKTTGLLGAHLTEAWLDHRWYAHIREWGIGD